MIVSSARGAAAAAGNAAAVVEKIGVEVGVADAVARRLHLAKVDAEVAGALAHGGGGEDLRAVRSRRGCRARASGSALGAGAGAASGSATAMTGIASSCSAVGASAPSASGCSTFSGAAGGSGRRVALRLDLDQHRSDRDLVADFAGQLLHHARDRRFHFDRRLVGHHVGELLVFLDRVADLDVPGDDFGLGNAFADVGQLELIDAHASSTFLRAFFMRIGPGK